MFSSRASPHHMLILVTSRKKFTWHNVGTLDTPITKVAEFYVYTAMAGSSPLMLVVY